MDDATKRKIRRLAITGRWRAVRSELGQYLEQNPQDEEAKSEWLRFEKGQPMVLTLSAEERRKAAAQEAEKNLRQLMRQYPEDRVKLLNLSELKSILESIEEQHSVLVKSRHQVSPGTRQYIDTVKARKRAFVWRAMKTQLKYGGIILSLLAVAIVIWTGLRESAYDKLQDLKAALEAPAYDELTQKLKAADQPLNHFFCPNLSTYVARAQQWIDEHDELLNDLENKLARLESGAVKLSSLSTAEILNIESGIDRSQRGREQLLKRWQEICRKEYSALEKKKSEILQAIDAPLPPLPQWSGDVETDINNVAAYKTSLINMSLETQAAIKLYKVKSGAVERLNERIAHTDVLLREMHQIRAVLKTLGTSRSYKSFRENIARLTIKYYTPAQQLADIKQHLPEEENVAYRMVDPHGNFTAEHLMAAHAIFVNSAPSFPPEFPATPQVLIIPEDILTAPSLLNKIYTLKTPEGETWYSTIRPERDESGFTTYRRSIVDPKFTLDDNRREFQDGSAYQLGEIDATHLLRDLKIERNDFFITVNLPSMLTAVLNYKEGKHPALAQASVYRCLLLITDAHPHTMLNGVRFSPTLRKHSASFHALLKRLDIDLKPGCWLSPSPQVERAEKAFREWFRTHAGCDYRAEMAQNFMAAYYKRPQFCGYLDEHGKVKIFIKLKAGEKLWYVSQDGIKCSSSIEEIETGRPLSPLFKVKNN